MKPDPLFVIIGAGPVGLWTALQIKKQLPESRIILCEQHESYVRSHVLRLDKLSFFLYCKKSHDERERDFYNSIVSSNKKIGPTYIRTNQLEQALRKYAIDLSIVIEKRRINHPLEAEQLYPDATCFIAADGAHSVTRSTLLGKKDTITVPMQYVVELKYEAQNSEAQKISFVDSYKTQKIMNFMGFEYIGKAGEHLTPITLRYFVDTETFQALPEANYKSPILLDQTTIPQKLNSDIHTYLNMRRAKTQENYLPGSAKITKLLLSRYRARRFSIVHKTALWFLVGDAAFGVPYFRALNAGMMCGSILAKICFFLARYSRPIFFARIAYEWLVLARYVTESVIACSKDNLLKLYNQYRILSGKTPWQTIRWSNDEIFSYQMHNDADI